MTEGNQFIRPFGRHDRSKPRDPKNITLLGSTIADHRQRVPIHTDPSVGPGGPVGFGLATHIDHVGGPVVIKMTKCGHTHQFAPNGEKLHLGTTERIPRKGVALVTRYHQKTAAMRLW